MPAETKTTLVWHLKDEVSGPAGGIASKLGGLVSPLGLATVGVGALAGGLVLAAQAAAEEEVNIAKLGAALEASVPGWDGNTEAIEALITERENLAFSDDELRASFAALVTSTGDVEEAAELQATAMDLARLKGVDLQTASEALAKANAGSTRELRALGLEIDENATKTEVLAAIQQAATGQAAAYADTSAAKWEVLQNKFGNVVEKVGSALLPVLETLLDFAIEELIPALEDFAELVGPIIGGAIETLGPIISTFIDNVVKPAIQFISDLVDFIGDAIQLFIDLGEQAASKEDYLPGGSKGPASGTRGGTKTAFVTGGMIMAAPIPGGTLGGVPVQIPIIVDGREIARVVDENLYFDLRRASPQSGRA